MCRNTPPFLSESLLNQFAASGRDCGEGLIGAWGCGTSPTPVEPGGGMTVYEMIRQAILDKDIVIATYDGHAREMCPHVIGMKNGRPQALFYQFRIGGLQPSWLRPLPSGVSPTPLTINGIALIKVSKYSGLSEIIAHL